MRHKGLTRCALAAAVVLLAVPALAQNYPLDFELGYRFVNVSGDNEMYRSQINEREGFLLRSLTLSASDFNGKVGFVDKFRLDVSDIGAGPAGSVRLEMGKSEIYRFKFTYNRYQMFSALPAFANPLLSSGVTLGQQTYERLRNVYDAELEILPGKIFTPIVGFTYNRYTGPSTSTVHIGQDEFRLNQSFLSYDEEPRVGFAFATGPVAINFMQGWRKYHEEEQSMLTPGAGNGNSNITILGQQQTLVSYSRSAVTDVNIPITTASGVYQLGCFGKVLGTYVRGTGGTDTQGPTNLDGTLVNFDIARFFGGLNETLSSSVQNLFWRGAVRAELTPMDGIEVTGGWVKNFRELTGFELLSQIFYNTQTYGGSSTPNIQQILNINNGLSRFNETFDLGVVARKVGPFGLRFGYSHTKQGTSVDEDVAEIVVPGGQSGEYNRKINTYDAGLTFAVGFLTLGADYRGENADQAIMRSDFTLRNTWRGRAVIQVGKFLRIAGTGQWTDEKNNSVGINSTGTFRQVGGDVDITPADWLSFRFSGSNFAAQTHMPVLNPINQLSFDSINIDDGRSYEGGLTLRLKPVQFEVSGGEYKNYGSFGFKIDRVRGRLEVPVVKRLSLVGELGYDKYTETVYTYGDYGATRVGLYAHWRAF
ncbi:MAG: hypothetical protein ACHQPI_11765 [Thermoanaerobaculia bacterium]